MSSSFFAIPTVQAVQYAVTDWDGFSPDYEVAGLDNFRRALTADDLFMNALGNNLTCMLVVVFQTILALLLAVLLVRNSTGSTLLRGLFFFPTILSWVSVAYTWKFIYDPNFGLANTVLRAVGLEELQSSFLGNDAAAIYWVALARRRRPVAALPVDHLADDRAGDDDRHRVHDDPVLQGVRPDPRPGGGVKA